MRNVSHYESPVIFDEQYFRSNISSIVLEKLNLFFLRTNHSKNSNHPQKKNISISPKKTPSFRQSSARRNFPALFDARCGNVFQPLNLSSRKYWLFCWATEQQSPNMIKHGGISGWEEERNRNTFEEETLAISLTTSGNRFRLFGTKSPQTAVYWFSTRCFLIKLCAARILNQVRICFFFFLRCAYFDFPPTVFLSNAIFFQFIHRKIRLLLLFLCSDPCRCSLFSTLWRPDDVLVHGTLFNVETKTIPSGGFRLRHNHWKVTKIDPDFRFHPDDADDGGNKTQNPSGSPLDLRWPHFRGLASSLYCAVDAGIGPSAPKRMNLIIITVVIVSGCTSCVSWAQLVHTVLSRAWHSSSTLTGGATLQPFCGWWVAGSSWKSIHTRALVAAHTTTNSL